MRDCEVAREAEAMQIPPPKPPQPVAPQELGPDVRCAIVVGGTFDPIHLAHVKVPREARATLKEPEWRESWLVFVPAALSPFKVAREEKPEHRIRGASSSERVSLVRIAIEGIERACVWTDEIDRAGVDAHGRIEPSFTIESVRRLKEARPKLSLRLLIGADQACSLHRWRDCHELIRLAPPICVLRAPVETVDAMRQGLAASGEWSESEMRVLEAGAIATTLIEASSTEIRAELAAGTPARQIRILDPKVAAEIDRLGLYRPL